MDYKSKRVEILSANTTPEKMDPAELLSISSVEQKINAMELDSRNKLISIKAEQMKNKDFFANHLRSLRQACLAPAEPSAFQLVVEKAEENAKGHSTSESRIQQVLSNSKDKLDQTLEKVKTLQRLIQQDSRSANNEIANREALKSKKREIEEQFKETARQGQEDAKKLKEIKLMELQEQQKKAQERRQRQKENHQLAVKKHRETEVNLHQMKLEVQSLERRQQLHRRLQSPTTATRAAAKRHFNHVSVQSPKKKPSKAVFTAKYDEEHANQSDEESQPKKKYIEVLMSPSKKLASRVMIPEDYQIPKH
ncbi:hypothetical protein CAEBREN_25651 [Caenorhabditis brenneri]|uniref:Uncharacterized protein n=1 Tax=Caenorhabditis brenneri TaxID=135651 RepID=G0PCI0_CAEBE|nr:hypothetical protein CAEBREN_25651 [Caenorhabditis brenneri]